MGRDFTAVGGEKGLAVDPGGLVDHRQEVVLEENCTVGEGEEGGSRSCRHGSLKLYGLGVGRVRRR